jgi:O-acetylhomoserine/O-acetylserine sulfhydrylase-like pyridoxal-dependent enzyme
MSGDTPRGAGNAGRRERSAALSVGIEHIDDILADLDQALAAAASGLAVAAE